MFIYISSILLVMGQIWTEKYRPKTFSEVKGQKEIVNRISAFCSQDNLPHMLFAGPAGIGKTTLSLIIARELFQDSWKYNFLELNASDARGIDVIRNQVKDFARTKALANVPFKIIFLDECDALTKEAQQALRRTMETFSQTCRFILSCNVPSKLIDPIKSRCTIFRSKPLEKEGIMEIIDIIAQGEGLTIEAKDLLYEVTEGDVRKLENLLQSCASMNTAITEDVIMAVVAKAKPKDVRDAMEMAIAGKFLDARKKVLDIMLNQGLSGLDIIKQIQREVFSLEIDDQKKLDFVEKCGEIEFRLVEGSDDYVQIEALFAYFTRK